MFSYLLLHCVHKEIQEFVIYERFPHDEQWTSYDVVPVVVLAAALGAIAALHTRLMLGVAARRKSLTAYLNTKLPYAVIWETIFYGALCALCSGGASILGGCLDDGESGLKYVRFHCGENQYNPVASLLVNTSHSAVKLLFSGKNAGELPAQANLIAFVTYFLLNVGLTGLPVPGGAFTATMLLGGLFGRGCADLGLHLGLEFLCRDRGIYAVVGSAAMLCGFKQMTLCVVVIIVECVEDLALSPVVMLSVAVATWVNRAIIRRGHDEAQIHAKRLPYLDGELPTNLDAAFATRLMDDSPLETRLSAHMKLGDVQQALEHSEVSEFPVLDQEGVCIGVASRPHLQKVYNAADPNSGRSVDISKIMDPTPFSISQDMPAPRLYALFSKANERSVVVTSSGWDGEIRGTFVGLISREGLIEHAHEASADDDRGMQSLRL